MADDETGNADHPRSSGSASQPRRVAAGELFGKARELVISHRGEEYRLRITSKGKLILTK